mgnify:CR=1 FL=1
MRRVSAKQAKRLEEYIASFIAVEREHVSVTMSRLKAKGLVERRGREWRTCG